FRSREALQQRVARRSRTVNQQGGIAFHQKEIEQDFSLWRQKRCIESLARFQAFDIVGDQPLQEGAGFGSGDGDDRAVGEMNDGHGYEVVRAASVAKTWAAS